MTTYAGRGRPRHPLPRSAPPPPPPPAAGGDRPAHLVDMYVSTREGGREGGRGRLQHCSRSGIGQVVRHGRRGKATRRRRGGRGHQVKSFQLATAAAADDAERARPIKLRGEINGLSNRRRRRARAYCAFVGVGEGSMSQSHRKWITGQHEVHFVPFVYAT